MGKEIRLRIEACYGDLRPSEKRAADYVLEHLEELKLLPLNQLAEQAKVSQPTVMRMIKALGQARRIDIYSVENSNVTAQDLLTKLLYLGLDCRHYGDNYLQGICAGSLRPGDVAVGVSYSGNSRDTVDAVKAARKAGATVIAITNFRDSLITRYADLLLCTSQDQVFYGDAIFSRTTQIMIVDMIYMGLLASDYERYVKILNKNSRVARDRAYLPEKKDEPGR